MLDMRKGISYAIIMLLLTATLAVPVVSAHVTQQTLQDDILDDIFAVPLHLDRSSDSGCMQGQLSDSNVTVEGREITGKDKIKNIALALSDKGVQRLRKELVERGFNPSAKDINVIEVKTTNESTTITSLIVAMPYNGKNKNDSAVITYVSNELGTAAVASVMSNGMLSVVNYDSITGNAVTTMSLQCDLCKWLVGLLCAGATKSGCTKGCGLLCAKVKDPRAIAICYGTCWLACSFLVMYKACNLGANTVCNKVKLCP